MHVRMRGAEAVLQKTKFLNRDCVIKNRITKNYRRGELDVLLRKRRTKAEARLLHGAKIAGVSCPTVLFVDDFSIIMTFIGGVRPSMSRMQAREAGRYLAMLHNHGIVHGDYTPANLLEAGSTMHVIDFGLGFFSTDVEDFAIDVFTMLKALDKKKHYDFLQGYKKCMRYNEVLKRTKAITTRMRYGGGAGLIAKGNSCLGRHSP